MNLCKDKVAIVTGAAGSGIGRSTALTLAREGAAVAVDYRTSAQSAEAIVASIRSRGGKALAVQADVSVEADVQRLVAATERELGPVDILVNNAGGGWEIKDYTEMTMQQWRATLAMEIDATLLLLKHIVPGMRQRKWGRIIHVGMDRILHMAKTKGVAPDYCLGKAARTWMTTALGLQELRSGITVNCVAPGITPAFASLEQAAECCAHGPTWQTRTKLCPQDVAEGIAFLCSDAARFISGCELPYEAI